MAIYLLFYLVSKIILKYLQSSNLPLCSVKHFNDTPLNHYWSCTSFAVNLTIDHLVLHLPTHTSFSLLDCASNHTLDSLHIPSATLSFGESFPDHRSVVYAAHAKVSTAGVYYFLFHTLTYSLCGRSTHKAILKAN